LTYGRKEENVRPIFWKNRNKSYVVRTQDWDEFPNGRWGDSRSPAYGELDLYGIGLTCTNEQAQEWWGHPTTNQHIRRLFADYVLGEVKNLPWSDSPISPEVSSIRTRLVDLNRGGFLTINSQPAINGEKSSHPVHGWGPRNGYVYQKAYLECFCDSAYIDRVLGAIAKDPNITFHAVNKHGDLRTNTYSDGPNAVTWGVFPGKEIIQPTIVETVSFLAWKVSNLVLQVNVPRTKLTGLGMTGQNVTLMIHQQEN
jgi:methylenetetrahydrofolate reductase (NADPH)